jgi:hypothetical protein
MSQRGTEYVAMGLLFFIFNAISFTIYVVKARKNKEKINPEIWFYLVGSYIMSIIFLILVAFASSVS